MWLYFGMFGYNVICYNFFVVLDDKVVCVIVLLIDLLGGEVVGCFDVVDLIYEFWSVKLILVILNESVYSVVYVFVSVCE